MSHPDLDKLLPNLLPDEIAEAMREIFFLERFDNASARETLNFFYQEEFDLMTDGLEIMQAALDAED